MVVLVSLLVALLVLSFYVGADGCRGSGDDDCAGRGNGGSGGGTCDSCNGLGAAAAALRWWRRRRQWRRRPHRLCLWSSLLLLFK